MTTTTDLLVRDPATAARGRWLMLILLLAWQFMVAAGQDPHVGKHGCALAATAGGCQGTGLGGQVTRCIPRTPSCRR